VFVEARVNSKTCAGVRPGKKADVNCRMNYTNYGDTKGTVKLISAESFKDERSRGAEWRSAL